MGVCLSQSVWGGEQQLNEPASAELLPSWLCPEGIGGETDFVPALEELKI